MAKKTMEAPIPVFKEIVGNLFLPSDQKKLNRKTVVRTTVLLASHFPTWGVKDLYVGV